MNYLGHLYVAGDDLDLQLGGLLGDFVRGRDLSSYPERVARGIALHRSIDAYTDRHPAFRSACESLPAEYRLFSGILIDVYFGHLLARDWSRHHATPLTTFAAEIYRLWHPEPAWLPEKAARAFEAMTAGDWLTSYASLEGTEAALRRLDRRLSARICLVEALPDIVAVSARLEHCFEQYLPAVVDAARRTAASHKWGDGEISHDPGSRNVPLVRKTGSKPETPGESLRTPENTQEYAR
jgi:acyl carrier protein phosphodiesterase